MTRRHILWAALAVMISMFAYSAPAEAQATRTWVSGVGDDANPCSRTAPCKTFAGAISKTAAKGEINCLDPGGFGAVTITKSITISCGYTGGTILAAGTNAVVVNAALTDVVVLEGLLINGAGTGLNAVRILNGKVYIRQCSIRGFSAPDPNGAGVLVAGDASTRAFISETSIQNNRKGVDVQSKAAGVGNSAVLDRVVIDQNAVFSLSVAGPGTALVSNSLLIGSPSAILAPDGGNVISYGNNVIRGAGLPTQTITLQ